MKVTRRGVLAGAAVGGGLVVASLLWPQRFSAPLDPAEDEFAFDAWLKIALDGVITVAVPQLEMGQGVTTLLPQIVAMELGADWRQIAVEPTPPSGSYPNVPLATHWAPLWLASAPDLASNPDSLLARRFAERTRFTVTAEGTSLDAYEMPAREAAAAARGMLVAEAAERWDIAPELCRAENGFVIHEDKRLRFSELAAAASERDPPSPPPLLTEEPSESPLGVGDEALTAFPRLDLPAKIDGSFLFAGDIRLPRMVYAAIRHGPWDKARLREFRAAAARDVPGLVDVVEGNRWLAAAAENWWAAERALDLMEPIFGVVDPVDSQAITSAMDDALANGSTDRIALRGEAQAIAGDPTLTRRYDIAPAMHAPVETATATAWINEGKLSLWIACQAPERAREAAAKAAGMALTDTILIPTAAGGSFDARLTYAHAIEVAVLAKALGRPVQLIWSRAQEMAASPPRAPFAAEIAARAGRDGSPVAWRTKIATPPFMREQGARMLENRTTWAAREETRGRTDPLACSGAVPAYEIPSLAVDYAPVDCGLPVARMRGGADAMTAFATESFIDELARALGREPLSYRVSMLGQDLRMVECLQRAARLGGWEGGSVTSGQGIACHRMEIAGRVGRIACVAQVSMGEGGLQVERLSAAVDIGRIVNRDLARQQIEGGLVFGQSLCTGGDISYTRGYPTSGGLASLRLMRLADTPEIAIDFIVSDADPFDPGDLGVTVAAPAIANAFAAATGRRLRKLPFDLTGEAS